MWYVSRFHLRVNKLKLCNILSILDEFWILSWALLIIQSTFLKDALSDFFFSDSLVALVLVSTFWNLCINPLLKVF